MTKVSQVEKFLCKNFFRDVFERADFPGFVQSTNHFLKNSDFSLLFGSVVFLFVNKFICKKQKILLSQHFKAYSHFHQTFNSKIFSIILKSYLYAYIHQSRSILFRILNQSLDRSSNVTDRNIARCIRHRTFLSLKNNLAY